MWSWWRCWKFHPIPPLVRKWRGLIDPIISPRKEIALPLLHARQVNLIYSPTCIPKIILTYVVEMEMNNCSNVYFRSMLQCADFVTLFIQIRNWNILGTAYIYIVHMEIFTSRRARGEHFRCADEPGTWLSHYRRSQDPWTQPHGR